MAEEALDSLKSIPGEVQKPSKFIKGHSCGVCQKWFKRMGDLRRHGSVHFKEKLIPCDHCDLKFVSKDRLYHHRKYFSLEKDYKCNFCSRAFKTYASLQTHLVIHTGERPYVCEMCNITFRRKNALHYHYASLTKLAHHKKFEQFKQFEHLVEKFKFLTNDGRENICTVCKKQFKTAKHLKRHTLIHGRASFECDICGLAFKQKHYILRHKRTMHSTNRKFFPCDICKKTFVSNYSVKLHKAAAHEYSKPYKCEICPRSYVKKPQLANHMLSHDGVKKYACTMCDKRYTNISCLKYHIREHTGEKPYECQDCGKAFKGIEMLKNHKNKCNKIETTVETKEQTGDSKIGLVLPNNENTTDKNRITLSGNTNKDIKKESDEKDSITKIVNQETSKSHPPVKLFCFGGKVVLPQNIKFIKVQNPAEFNLLRVTRLFERYRCLSNV